MDDDKIHLGPGMVMVRSDGPDEAPIRMIIGDAESHFSADAAMRLAIRLADEVAAYAERRGLVKSPFPPRPE